MCSTRSVAHSHGKVKNINATTNIRTHIYHSINMNQNGMKAIQGKALVFARSKWGKLKEKKNCGGRKVLAKANATQ